MACRGCLECLLKLLNFLLAVVGLGMVGYGIYLFVEYKRATDNSVTLDPVNGDQSYVSFGRPMLMAVALSSNVLDNLPKAWYVSPYLVCFTSLVIMVFEFDDVRFCFYHVNAGSFTCSLVSAWLCLLSHAAAVLVLVQGASVAYLVYPD